MGKPSWRVGAYLAATLAVGVGVALLARGAGDPEPGAEPLGAEPAPPSPPATSPSLPTGSEEPAAGRKRERAEGRSEGRDAEGDRKGDEDSGQESDDRADRDPDLLAARRTYHAYIAAINARDGAALCRLIAPGFERVVGLPVRRGSCAKRVRRSIGHEDPRGFPVWKRTSLSLIEGVARSGETVRVNAGLVTRFADREQPSIESDIAYLEPRPRGRFRLVKASAALYRAVGKPDIPPSVITPP